MNSIQQYIITQITNDKVRIFYLRIIFLVFLIIGLVNQLIFNNLKLAYLNYLFVLLVVIAMIINSGKYFSNLLKVNVILIVIYFNITSSNLFSCNEYFPSFYWYLVVPLTAKLICDISLSLVWSGIIIFTIILYAILINYKIINTPEDIEKFNYYFYDQLELNIVAIVILYFINKFHKTLIEKLVETNLNLNKTQHQLIESQKYKDLFFANISHEIRTPLNIIIGMVTLLKEKKQDSVEKEYMNTINYSSNLLLNIINDILDISKLNENNFKLVESSENIKQVIQQVFEIFKQEASAKNIKFELVFSNNFPVYAKIDKIRVSQIVINLVKNAIKFTKVGLIKIVCNFTENQEICIEVKDTGIGINSDYIDKIFSNYTQENDYISQNYGGTGLGLSLSYKLAILMKGNLVCESKKGEGSIFKFTMPYIFSEPVEIVIETDIINEKINNLKIIIADDDQLNLLVTKKVITNKLPKLVIKTAENGMVVLDILAKENIDLVLLDLQMPILDGIATCKKIRETNNDIKIIALTASINDSVKEACFEAGMNDYLNKPFEVGDLIAKINKLFSIN